MMSKIGLIMILYNRYETMIWLYEREVDIMNGIFMFPEMFYNHIKDSKLKMPEDFENYDPEEYPHFHVFMLTHLGQPIDIAALEDNANIIADIPENAIKSVTLNDLMEKGVVFGTGDLV